MQIIEQSVDDRVRNQEQQQLERNSEVSNDTAMAEQNVPVAEGTLFIKNVAIKDFLTYQDFRMESSSGLSLSSGCNLVLGKNGSGKSSFLNAIIYVLSDKFSSMTKHQKRGMLNNIAQQTSASQQRQKNKSQQNAAAQGPSAAAVKSQRLDANTYWVEVTLDNSQHRIPVQASEITLRKSYNCNTDREDYHINGQPISQKDLFNLFESGNFSLSSQSQFQIVAQGKVQQLVDKGEAGFLEMLKEVTGTALFDQKIGSMMKSIDEAKGKKNQLQQVLAQIKDKLDKLREEIEVFNGYDKVEKDKKALERCLYHQKIQLNQAELEQIWQQKKALMAERESLLAKREEFLREQNLNDDDLGAKTKAERLKDEIGGLEHKIMSLQQVRQELMNKQLTELESFGNMGGQQTTSLYGTGQQRSLLDYFGAGGLGAQNFKQQLAEISANIENMKQDTSTLDQAKAKVSSEIQKVKSKLDEMEKAKDSLLLQREAAKNMSTPAQITKFYKEEQNRLQVQNSQAGQDLGDAQREQANLTKQIAELKKQLVVIEADLETTQVSMREALVKSEQARKTKRDIAGEVKTQIFKQNELEHEVKVQQQRISGYVKQIERVEPVFGALQRIEQKCKEQNIRGYKGLLIDHLVCKSENFMACVDVAAKSKLFSIIVDTLETAKLVLQINKEIKGGVINIYPLETLDQMKKPAKQVPKGVKSMLDIVQLTPSADRRLELLLQNIFAKAVLVKSYDEGMQVAKEHNLTCITADLEVVYAGAFISKVGHYNRAQMARFSIYQQVFKIKAAIQQKLDQIKSIQADRDKNDKSDLEALRDLQKSEVSLSQLRQTAQQLNADEFEVKTQIAHKSNNLREAEKQIEHCRIREADFGSQLKDISTILKNPKKAAPQQFSEQDQGRLLQLNKKISELHLKTNDLQAQFVQIQNQIEQKHQLVNESYMPRQLQLKSLVLEAQQTHSFAQSDGLANEETGVQTGLDFGFGKDQEYSSHLQNEKTAINQQLEALDQELRRKQEELNEQIQLTQTQNAGAGVPAGTQTQDLMQAESQFPGGNNNALSPTQHELIQSLRAKTQEVEELSMKIDELQQINNSLESLMSKVQRFNMDLFKETQVKMSSGQMTQAELRKLIGEQNKQLETFPRQNKNCVEYYEKYKLKYEELDSKFTQQQKTEDQISELLHSLKDKKAKSIEDNFKLLSRNFSSIFKSIVKDGSAQLKLVKFGKGDVSQQSEPSQFPEVGQSQQLNIGDSLYKGIRVLVSFTARQQSLDNADAQGKEVISSLEDERISKTEHSLEPLSLGHLSGGQKAVVAACLIFAIQKIEQAPFYIMDEFDSALDPQYCQGIAEQIQKLSRSHFDPVTGQQCAGSQFIMTTFKPYLVTNADKIFEVSFRNQKSQIATINQQKAKTIIEKQQK